MSNERLQQVLNLQQQIVQEHQEVAKKNQEVTDLLVQQQNQLHQYLSDHIENHTVSSESMNQVMDAIQDLKLLIKKNEKDKGAIEENKSQKKNTVEDDDASVEGAKEDITESLEPRDATASSTTVVPSPIHRKPRGLLRQKHTCYINSVMQALAAVDPNALEQGLGDTIGNEFRMNRTQQAWNYYEAIIVSHLSTEQIRDLNLRREFLDLIKQLREEGSAVHAFALQATLIKYLQKPWLKDFQRRKQAQKIAAEYDGETEQDAAEFYRTLLNLLFEKRGQAKIFSELFQVEVIPIVTCTQTKVVYACPGIRDWVLELNALSEIVATTVKDVEEFKIQAPTASITDLINYTMENHLTECKNDDCSPTGKLRFNKLPDYLMLKLPRHGTSRDMHVQEEITSPLPKLAYRVDFNDNNYTLDLSRYVKEGFEHPQDCMYELRAVVYHIGHTHDKGHYVAVSRTGSECNNWYQCNDNVIEQTTGPYLLEGPDYGQAYLAMYVKVRQTSSEDEIQEHEQQSMEVADVSAKSDDNTSVQDVGPTSALEKQENADK